MLIVNVYWLYAIVDIWLKMKKEPTNVSTLFQCCKKPLIEGRWINVVLTLIFGWKWKLSWRMFMDIVPTLIRQRWNYADRITPIQCRWPMLFQRWYLVENKSWINTCSSTLFRRWENNIANKNDFANNCCTDVRVTVAQ